MKKQGELTPKQKKYLEGMYTGSVLVEDVPPERCPDCSGETAKEINAELIKKMQQQAGEQTINHVLRDH